MNRQRFLLASAALAISILELSCTVVPPAVMPAPASSGVQMDLQQQYERLASEGGRVLKLQPAKSQVRIHVFRGGRAAKVGHNHVLSAPEFEGYFFLPDEGPTHSRFDLNFRLDQLAIDVPAHRSDLGPAFASELSDAAIAGTREHMLGPDNMQADLFPYVRIHSLSITGEGPKFAAHIAVELHGQTREMWVPLTVSGLPTQLNVTGSFVLRQTDFGVHPYSVLGGLISVQDEVVIDFSLKGD